VGALRDEFRSTGVTTRFGDTYEWISSAEGPGNAPIEARLETEKSGPRLTLRQDMGVYRQLGMAMGITFAVMATVFSLVILMGDLEASAFVAPAALLAMGAASWLGTRALTPWVEKRQRARFERVADRIELIAGAG
jgi:hypothetical protein